MTLPTGIHDFYSNCITFNIQFIPLNWDTSFEAQTFDGWQCQEEEENQFLVRICQTKSSNGFGNVFEIALIIVILIKIIFISIFKLIYYFSVIISLKTMVRFKMVGKWCFHHLKFHSLSTTYLSRLRLRQLKLTLLFLNKRIYIILKLVAFVCSN